MKLTSILRYAAMRDKAVLISYERPTDHKFVTMITEPNRGYSRIEVEAIRDTLNEVLADWPVEELSAAKA
jgi:hypothetical protein